MFKRIVPQNFANNPKLLKFFLAFSPNSVELVRALIYGATKISGLIVISQTSRMECPTDERILQGHQSMFIVPFFAVTGSSAQLMLN